MTRMTKWLLPVFALLTFGPLFGRAPQASTINATSCSQADVQTALNSAAGGDTVHIPAGTCVWTTAVSIPTPSGSGSINIFGAGSLTTVGGSDLTVIIDHVPHSPSDVAMLGMTTGPASSVVRVAGITFKEDGSSIHTNNGMVRFGGKTQNFRLDHCHFVLSGSIGSSLGLNFFGWIYGVVDHNILDLVAGTVNNGIQVGQDAWGNHTQGDGSWADDTTFGSNRFIFFEDNVVNGGAFDDCERGGRIVIRNNTMNASFIQTHEMGQDNRGCRAVEIYNNVSNGDTGIVEDVFFFDTRMGTSLLWGNVTTGHPILLNVYQDRTNTDHPQSQVPNGWGYCKPSLNTGGTPSPWDGNTDSTGYPCIDQVGRGKGDMLSGSFPTKVNSITGTIARPHEALEPVYEWLNQYNIPAGYNSNKCSTADSNTITANRDFYCYTLTWNGSAFAGTAFSGAVGTGSGLLSARPSTCTPKVAYWATDTNTLYQCGPSANTWTSYYTPFTYPHPLTQSSSSGTPPASPTNLTAAVN